MRSSNSRTPRSLILVLGVVAVSLFFLGPQMGSLDTDGDGCPDTPVVISSFTPVVRPSNFASAAHPRNRIQGAIVLAPVLHFYYVENDDSRSPAGRAALRSFCLLRC
jgi:hypothetical protein